MTQLYPLGQLDPPDRPLRRRGRFPGPLHGQRPGGGAGHPRGFIPAADSGSGLHAPNPYTNPPHGPTRYWMYYTARRHLHALRQAVTRAKAAWTHFNVIHSARDKICYCSTPLIWHIRPCEICGDNRRNSSVICGQNVLRMYEHWNRAMNK